jgi:hypothetical protein
MNLKLQDINFIKFLSMAALSQRNPASRRELEHSELHHAMKQANLQGKNKLYMPGGCSLPMQ